ncbi:MAG: flagellar basal body P-ring formation protein FlgA [Methylotenera sp.]|nr:flagellar basal body P-ring formation protein FlgA [Oligoflexia bacterium]
MLHKFFLQVFALVFAAIFFAAGFSSADESTLVSLQSVPGVPDAPSAQSVASNSLSELIRAELANRYPGARIEILGAPQMAGQFPENLSGARILTETAKGEAQFLAYTQSGVQSQGWVSFAAWMPTRVAARRIQPGERLSPELFIAQDVNVATGLAREYRGIMLPRDADLTRLETRQTILEGQFALNNGVQKVPDIKRGEGIVIRMLAGEIALSTQGTAQEPGYVDGTIRVLTLKTKRELVGKLRAGGVVEVKL